ncbi:MAG: carboxypeptidase regulatory-like domain-containing protein [Myxococcota bacterium]|nr:carboxypeptidase regulatory-like domain-containing protein [Myxococcota bacterium]
MALGQIYTGLLIAIFMSSSAKRETAPQQNAVTPPIPLHSTEIPYPKHRPSNQKLLTVVARMTIDEEGLITQATIIQSATPKLDAYVLEKVAWFRFSPATDRGKPVVVDIDFKIEFPPPLTPSAEPKPKPKTPPPTGKIHGLLLEQGTGKPIIGATIWVRREGFSQTKTSNEKGLFSIELTPRDYVLKIDAPGYYLFTGKEEVRLNEELKIKYLLARQSYKKYHSYMYGKRNRHLISRVALRENEIKKIPGTFGDPYRAISSMAGVTQAMSLLPYPMIRGTSPGQSALLLDGLEVPLLFHFFVLNAVIHPEFLRGIDYFASNAPVEYGGVTGGVIDGKTYGWRIPDRFTIDADLNLFQAGAYLRYPLPEQKLNIAASFRQGYPSFLMNLLNSETRSSYWDYQTQISRGTPRSGWSILVLGAGDTAYTLRHAEDFPQSAPTSSPEKIRKNIFLGSFHRLDTRYHHQFKGHRFRQRLTFTYEQTDVFSDSNRTMSLSIRPQSTWEKRWLEQLKTIVFTKAQVKSLKSPSSLASAESSESSGFVPEEGQRFITTGGFDLIWEPNETLSSSLGFRIDWYKQDDIDHLAYDPRLRTSIKLGTLYDMPFFLNTGIGIYHQAPRSSIPIPGLQIIGLNMGLIRSYQGTLAVVVEPALNWQVSLESYYNHLNPLYVDFGLNELTWEQEYDDDINDHISNENKQTDTQNNPTLVGIIGERKGRSYGFELTLRKKTSGNFFGWLSYAWAKSHRNKGEGWFRFDFDRNHIINCVAGFNLPNNWEFGLRFSFQSGTPLNTSNGINTGQSAPQYRLDLRIDKRAVWNNWLLDFYIDILNASLSGETGGTLSNDTFRIIIPTIGMRAIF